MEITSKHFEHGRMMVRIVQHDVSKGLSFDVAVDNLAAYLDIHRESVLLGIALANGEDA